MFGGTLNSKLCSINLLSYLCQQKAAEVHVYVSSHPTIVQCPSAGAFLVFADGGGGGNEARRAEVRAPKGRDATPEGPRCEA